MRSRVTTVAVLTAGIVCFSLALVRAQAGAQGKQDSARAAAAAAPTPRTADGHPDGCSCLGLCVLRLSIAQ